MDEHVEFLRRLFDSASEFQDGVRDLVRYCRSIDPSAPWSLLKNLDLEAEAESFGNWIVRNPPTGPFAEGIRAYYFGLSDDGTSVHLDGTCDFDPSDAACGWAASCAFRSDEDWTASDTLDAFSTLSEHRDPALGYLLCLGFTGLLIQKMIPNVLWRISAPRPVAVGYYSGDGYMVMSVGSKS